MNLEELAQVIRNGQNIQVKKADTEEDITQTILLQILIEIGDDTFLFSRTSHLSSLFGLQAISYSICLTISRANLQFLIVKNLFHGEKMRRISLLLQRARIPEILDEVANERIAVSKLSFEQAFLKPI